MRLFFSAKTNGPTRQVPTHIYNHVCLGIQKDIHIISHRISHKSYIFTTIQDLSILQPLKTTLIVRPLDLTPVSDVEPLFFGHLSYKTTFSWFHG